MDMSDDMKAWIDIEYDYQTSWRNKEKQLYATTMPINQI
jgi:hypothetical protein